MVRWQAPTVESQIVRSVRREIVIAGSLSSNVAHSLHILLQKEKPGLTIRADLFAMKCRRVDSNHRPKDYETSSNLDSTT